jgi:hypothetical protein
VAADVRARLILAAVATRAWNIPKFRLTSERPFFHPAEHAAFRMAAERVDSALIGRPSLPSFATWNIGMFQPSSCVAETATTRWDTSRPPCINQM